MFGPPPPFPGFGRPRSGRGDCCQGDAGFGGWVAAPGSLFGAGIFYCQVAGEKIPGLRQIPMEWWEETKPAPVDSSNAGDVVVDLLCSVVPTLRLVPEAGKPAGTSSGRRATGETDRQLPIA